MDAPIPPLIREAADRYVAWARERFGTRVRFASLFGSWVRGEADEDSDIDVAVVVEDLTWDERREAFRAVVDVEEALGPGVHIDAVVMSGAAWDELVARERLIAKDITAEGRAL